MSGDTQSSVTKINPLRGSILIPGDKSITHRAIILSALAQGRSRILGYLPSEDCEATLRAFKAMGIRISSELDRGIPCLVVHGKGLQGLAEPENIINCGNSGTTMRLMTGLLSAQPFFTVLTGDASLRLRPMARVMKPIREMGGEIHARANGNKAPLAISGRALSPIEYKLPIASAQVKSAILLAGLTVSGTTTVIEPGPCRDHTERMFQSFGISFKKEGNALSVRGGADFAARTIEVPGDISSAAFFLVAGSIIPGSEIKLCNVGVNPTRAAVLNILKKMGADIDLVLRETAGNEPVADLKVRAAPLKGCVVEGALMTAALDEFPILCIAAARAEGRTVFREAAELRVKESDRIEMMASALSGMGIAVETFPDGMAITGNPKWKGAFCKTAGDHRIAMSLVVAGLLAEGGNQIDDMICINTSFPDFMNLLVGLAELG
ncbi:MAG: 3-phosphoshikimate 1-carboxyvinyltransferase [Nitrospirota bacterium]|nr:3-phosphoshikimate 1-carboxyvinyltransferase [Nitrospirota bacterium]